MAMIEKVLVTGASPDHLNRNTVMRDYVAEGFRQALGAPAVENTPLEFAPTDLAEFDPDLVLVFGSCMPDNCDYGTLRAGCDRRGILLAFWLHDDPYELDFNYKAIETADLIFTNDKWAREFYDHPACYHLPMAASKAAHHRQVNEHKDIDLFFCGVGFENRRRLFSDLKPVLSGIDIRVLGDEWPADIPFAVNRRIDNQELGDYLTRSKFSLNIGRHLHLANDRYRLDPATPGPRTFEAAMAGSAQIYFVESLEIEEYYTDGEEILLADDVKDLERILERYLDAPQDIAAIGKAAQQRTLREHTYQHRASRILDIARGARHRRIHSGSSVFREGLKNRLIRDCGHAEYHEISEVWNLDIWRHADEYLRHLSGNAMDIGAFTGFNSFCLSQYFDKVYSVDHVCYLPDDRPENIEFVQADIDTHDYRLPDEFFNACFMIEILEHLRWSPLPLLKWLATHVGLLFITTPDDDEWPPLKDHEWVQKGHYSELPVATEGCEGNPIPMEHVKQYTMSEFVELLGECGFRVIELVRVGEGRHQMLAICQPRTA